MQPASLTLYSVIPAKAGIQGHKEGACHSPWTPAFAGVTEGSAAYGTGRIGRPGLMKAVD